MLRSIIVSPDRQLAGYLHRVLADTGEVSIVRVVDRYPDAIELSRLLQSYGPHVVFVTVDSASEVVRIYNHLEQLMPGIETVAVGRSADPQVLMDVMHAGIREFVALPLEPQCVADCLGRLKESRSRRAVAMQQSELLYSFVPAKPGCGATTLALNSTLAVTHHHDATGLLMDFDLNSGMIRFMLKLNSTYSILDAAEYAASMDDELWSQIATRYDALDVVHAGTLNPDIRVESIHIRRLLDFAKRRYKVVTADLSGNLEKYSMEIMHESRLIFLVCTPELASIHLAGEKLLYLRKMGLGDRVRLLLNRYSRKSCIRPSEVEDVVGAPVMMTFPNDYARVVEAMTEGAPVAAASDLGKACDVLGGLMVEQKSSKAVEPRRKLIDFFSISPGRLASEHGKT